MKPWKSKKENTIAYLSDFGVEKVKNLLMRPLPTPGPLLRLFPAWNLFPFLFTRAFVPQEAFPVLPHQLTPWIMALSSTMYLSFVSFVTFAILHLFVWLFD